ncbi:hypothetical protein KKF05_02680 [Patescibacteria group bacterium]|nr:hypothetical protein [Patescibacteria group bacterium]MBU1028660.1 hypothetical protein [Patescibacteria group bacterium]MBU1916361.1 hypothetical protein [Patescibacteria group bacterium]
MLDLKEVHQRLEELKHRRRDLNRMFKDELDQNESYKKIVEELKVLREKKKSIENVARVSCFGGSDELERIKEQIKDEKQLLTDLALNQYVAGQTVEIVENETRFVPQFSVKFKKEKSSYAEEQRAVRAESHPTRTFLPAEKAGEALVTI